jgi:ferredoxin
MSSPSASKTPPTPVAPVRFNALFVRIDNLLARLDGVLARALPAGSDPLGQSGRMANLALLVAVASGVLLLLWYSSSLTQAYASLDVLRGRTLGGWMRALHRYSSDLVMFFLLVHAVRMFFARKFTGARWLPWVAGIVLVGVVWFIGWTGFWLAWDQPAQKIASTSMRFLDALPIFGEPLSRLFLTDRLVPSLLFFVVFFFHMLLPLMIAVGLGVHLIRLNRVKLLPDRRLMIAFCVALFIGAWLVPAPLDAPAAMAEKAAHLTVDAWYLTPLALALRFQDGGLWLTLGGVFILGAGLPWLLGRRFTPRANEEGVRPSADFQTVVEVSRCHACTQCVQDCPFDAVSMVPRTDGKRFETQAWVDPSKCVGCAVCVGSCDSEAMHLPWFDAVAVEPRILAEAVGALSNGKPVCVALVATDTVGGMTFFDQAVWRARLPDYQVHTVPTASWVRPKFVERLRAAGVARVLIVRDARAEAAARDGNRWPQDRFSGLREPAFRPARAGGVTDGVLVVDFNPSAPDHLRHEAAAFVVGKPVKTDTPAWTPLRVAGVLGLLATILAATLSLSHLKVANPESAEPELVFSFKALGEREAAPDAGAASDDSKVPIHMRGAPLGKPNRVPVRIRLTVDEATEERSYAAKGISSDGPAIDVWRLPLSPGPHAVTIEVSSGENAEPRRWQGRIVAIERRLHVVTYDPMDGFRVE